MLIKPIRDVISDHSLMSVSLERVKEQLRILDSDEDTLLAQYIESSTSFLEEWTGYYMMPGLITAFYNYCSSCCLVYLMAGRPFNSISLVEVKQDGTYVAITDSDFVLTELEWETHLCINRDIQIDSQCVSFSSDCVDVVDPVKIAYNVGEFRTLQIASIVTTTSGTPNIGTVATVTAHGLKINDQVIHADTGEISYDGTFTVISITSATTYTFEYLGSAAPASVIGTVTIPEIPAQLQLAVMQMVAKMYENRGDCCDECGNVPCVSQTLAAQFKRIIIRSSTRIYNDCNCG